MTGQDGGCDGKAERSKTVRRRGCARGLVRLGLRRPIRGKPLFLFVDIGKIPKEEISEMTKWMILGRPRELYFDATGRFRAGNPGSLRRKPIEPKPPPHNDDFRDARGRLLRQPPWVLKWTKRGKSRCPKPNTEMPKDE